MSLRGAPSVGVAVAPHRWPLGGRARTPAAPQTHADTVECLKETAADPECPPYRWKLTERGKSSIVVVAW